LIGGRLDRSSAASDLRFLGCIDRATLRAGRPWRVGWDCHEPVEQPVDRTAATADRTDSTTTAWSNRWSAGPGSLRVQSRRWISHHLTHSVGPSAPI
jgi:hypothetical protein